MTTDPRDDSHAQIRTIFRLLGPFVIMAGLAFLAVGMADFFQADGMPTMFWCNFVGMPLLALGGWICQLGYMGSFYRYMSREATPVLGETFNNLAEGTSGGMRSMARAVGEGFAAARADRVKVAEVACSKCGSMEPAHASYCDQCGTSLTAPKCPQCGKAGNHDARFCHHCGAQFE